MALQKNKLAIPLNSGIETGVDEHQQPLGQFRKLENITFDITGKVTKRTGYDALPLTNVNNQAIESCTSLTKLNNELNLIANNEFYSYIKTVEKWDKKGNVFSAIPTSTNILRNSISQKNIDSAHTQGLDAFVFEDDNGVHLSLVDNENGNFLLSNILLSATATQPKVVQREGTVYCFFTEAAEIKFRKFSIFDFQNIEAEVVVLSTLSLTNPIYDIEVIDDQLIVALNNNTASSTLAFVKIDTEDNISSLIEVAGATPTASICIQADSASRVLCSYADSNTISVVIFNITLGVKILTETLIDTLPEIKNATMVEKSTGQYNVFYEIGDANPQNHYIKTSTISLSGTFTTPTILKRSVGLASKAFKFEEETYITTIHQAPLQSTYFIIKDDSEIITKLSPNTAGSLLSTGSLPHISPITTSSFLLGSQVKGRLVEDNGIFFSLLGVNRSIIEFEPASKHENATLANNLHIAGGFLKMYDGQQIVEHGFHIFPEGLENASSSTTGGFLSDGTYEYIALYAWNDAQGNTHRSAASIALPTILTGSTATQTQSITVPTLRLTEKADVIVELYRTESNGTIFYKVSDPATPPQNNTTLNTITIIDTTSDEDLINNEVLYTTGNVLENIAAPASNLIESFQNRIFLINANEDKLFYSKITFEGFPVEFNDALTITIPDRGDSCTALKSMDDKLVIFKEDSIYFLSGDGPNNLGEQDTFIEPELISSEIGCINEKSVVLTPSGLFFKSQKGIYLLSKSLSLTYIGAPVEIHNDLTITSATVVADKNQIRFTTNNGDCLVYNFYQKKWATFTNYKALSSIVIENSFYYLRTDDLIYQEATHFSDNGTSIKTRIETGWLNFAGVQAFQRVYRMLLLGNFKSAHKLKIKVAYNFIDAYTQEVTINSSDVIDSTTYGSYSPYGSETTYGAPNQYQIRVDFKKQKCETMRVCIEDILEIPGQSLDISSLLFIVGAKVGEYKNSETKQFGTK